MDRSHGNKNESQKKSHFKFEENNSNKINFSELQQIQPTAADLSELQQSTSDQRHLHQTYQKLQQQLIAKNKVSILSNAQQVSSIQLSLEKTIK